MKHRKKLIFSVWEAEKVAQAGDASAPHPHQDQDQHDSSHRKHPHPTVHRRTKILEIQHRVGIEVLEHVACQV